MSGVVLTSPHPPPCARGTHKEWPPAREGGEGKAPTALSGHAPRRDVARLAVAQRPDAEVERGRRHRPTQRDAHAAADLGGPRQVVVQGLGEVAPAGVVRIGVGREVRKAARPEPVELDRPQGERRSEEHTSELQSPCNLVCRLLLEKKKKIE